MTTTAAQVAVTTSALPFSPLTDIELANRRDAAAWLAASTLTISDRYPSLDCPDVARDALREARQAVEYQDAAMVRIRARLEATS